MGRPMTRGVYRTRNKESDSQYAHVEYDIHADMDIPEQRYRDRRYQPEFDRLTWKNDYDAAEAVKKA